MPTKNDLIQQINGQAQAYMGYGPWFQFAGMTSFRKDQLEVILQRSVQLVELKRQADAIKATFPGQRLDVVTLFPHVAEGDELARIESYHDLLRQCCDLWLSLSKGV